MKAIATNPRKPTKRVAFSAAEETARDVEEAAWAAGAVSRKIPLVKAEAQRRVELVVPPDEALEQISEGVALLDKGKASWTVAEKARAVELRGRRTQVVAVRAAGKALAVSLQTMTPAEIDALDVTDAVHWP